MLGSAHADTPFDATASAYGFDFVISNPGSIPAGISPEGAGPVAQSELTNLPSGTSFASFPYPGDVVAGVPGLASGIVIGLPQLPAYPLLVSSGLGEGQKSANQPGIGLTADTETNQGHAHGTFGTDGSGALADANVVADPGGGVTATAVSQYNGLNFAGLGTIGQVNSQAVATQAADGTVTTSSKLEITGLDIPALQLTLPAVTPAPAPIPGLPIPQVPLPFAGVTLNAPHLGFVDGQFTVQIPLLGNQQFAVPANLVLDALKASGIEASFSKAITTPTSVVGSTFVLHYKVPAPPDNPAYTGATDVTLTLGRASASVVGDGSGLNPVDTSGSGGGTVNPPSTTSSGSTGSVPAATTSGGSGGAVLPTAGTTGTGGVTPVTPGILPDTSGTTTGGGQPPVVSAQGSSDVTTASFARRGPLSWGIYLVLVAAGIVGTFSTQSLRLLGVRQR